MICPNFGGNMVTSVRESEEIVLVLPCTHGWGGYQDIETEIVRTTVYNCGSRGNSGSAVTRLPGRSYCSHDLWWAVFFSAKKAIGIALLFMICISLFPSAFASQPEIAPRAAICSCGGRLFEKYRVETSESIVACLVYGYPYIDRLTDYYGVNYLKCDTCGQEAVNFRVFLYAERVWH